MKQQKEERDIKHLEMLDVIRNWYHKQNHCLINETAFKFCVQVKRMKQLEEERDMLRQGLEMLDTARVWYHKQIAAIEVKQRNFDSAPSSVSMIVKRRMCPVII